MGQTKSKAAVQSLSEQISSIASSTVQSCVVTSEQTQTHDTVNNGWSFWTTVKLNQQTDVSSTCFSDTTKQIDLQNKIISAITNASTAEGVGLVSAFGASKSAAVTNLTARIKNSITMSNIQRSYNSIKQSQSAKYTNNGVAMFTSIELVQGAKLFAAATLKEMDTAGIFNDIGNYVDQQSSAKTSSPLDVFSGLFDSVYSILFLIFIILAIVGGGVALYLFSGDISDDAATAATSTIATDE